MISTLRKENVEPLSIIALTGQRNLKSLDSYSSTSMEQLKDMSAKLSNITAPDQVRSPVKSTESKILKPSIAAQQSEKPENSSKNLFTEQFSTTATSALLEMLALTLESILRFRRRSLNGSRLFQIVIFTYTGARQTQEKAKISFKIHNE